MDRVIEKKGFPWRRVALPAGIVLAIAVLAWFMLSGTGGRSLVVDTARIAIAEVRPGVFEDFIPIRGRVTPRSTVYLDAIEGGRVEERLLEDGSMVAAGDLIVVLSNTQLQLNVTQNEAMVTEQLNNMRTIELQLEQNRLQHKRNLVELDYQITRLQRQVDRLSNLDTAGVVVKSQLEDAEDELAYFINRREVTLESQETDARLQETQLEFLTQAGGQLEENLRFARKNLDALNVRAPVSGKLSGLDLAFPCALHQLKARHLPRLDGLLFDGPHLGRCQQVCHGQFTKVFILPVFCAYRPFRRRARHNQTVSGTICTPSHGPSKPGNGPPIAT